MIVAATSGDLFYVEDIVLVLVSAKGDVGVLSNLPARHCNRSVMTLLRRRLRCVVGVYEGVVHVEAAAGRLFEHSGDRI
jgi:hypothetical protein